MMTVTDKNGLGNGKKISDVLNEQKKHLETVKCIAKVWKEIYDSIPIGIIIFFHENSTAHESNSTNVRWFNISMRYRKYDGTVQTLRFD